MRAEWVVAPTWRAHGEGAVTTVQTPLLRFPSVLCTIDLVAAAILDSHLQQIIRSFCIITRDSIPRISFYTFDACKDLDIQMGDEANDAVEVKGKQPVVDKSRHGNYIPYPKPLADYKEVFANTGLFMETLEKLHLAMSTKFMVPVIGGKELDLHQLFVEVTSRGGLEKVIRDRRWREVTAAFNFPSTATNASFVLRRYYISLLHHYEQMYFFGSQGWVSYPTVPLLVTAADSAPYEGLSEPLMPHHDTPSGGPRRRKRNDDFPYTGLPNRQVVGVIDGKFEHGYFVTVAIGTAKLRGILYHASEQNAAAPNDSDATGVVRRRRRRKKLSKRDPTHPKPNRSGYNFFFAEQHAKLKPLNPGKDREISKMIGDLWNKLTEAEKAVYQERGLKDKERYRSEMEVYRERLKMGQLISTAIPIQQRPAEPEMVMGNLDSKVETGEGDLSLTNPNDSSSKGIDSEGKMSGDDDSETETSPELDGNAAESTSLAEGDQYELRHRDFDEKMEEDECDSPSSSEDPVSKKVGESSNDKL